MAAAFGWSQHKGAVHSSILLWYGRRRRSWMDEKRVVHIVDDEDSIRRSTGFMLKKSGFSVTPWVSGVEFLKNLKHTEQGCILLDVRMPEMDGLEVQQRSEERRVGNERVSTCRSRWARDH